MVNTLKIKGRIIEKGLTIQKIAKEMELSGYQLGKKISGGSIMTLDEANKLQDILSIPDCDFMDYFFA